MPVFFLVLDWRVSAFFATREIAGGGGANKGEQGRTAPMAEKANEGGWDSTPQ